MTSGLPPADAAARTDRPATQDEKKTPAARPTSLEGLDEGAFEEAMHTSPEGVEARRARLK